MGCGAADVLPGRPRLGGERLVGQLGLVHLQRATHGLAVLVRRSATRRSPGRAADSETSARTALGAPDEPEPDPGRPLLLQAN